MENNYPINGKHLVVVGGGLAGCSVAHFAQNFFDKIILIDDFNPQRRNAFLSNAGSLHVGYGTTGHAHSAMIKNESPLLDTIKMSLKHPSVFSLWFNPTVGGAYRSLSTLWNLYNKEVANEGAAIFYYLYKRSAEIIEKIIKQEKVPTKKGRMALCRTKEYFNYIQKQLKIANKKFVINGKVLSDLKSIRKLLPSAPDGIAGGIYYEDDISFHPPTFSDAWIKKLGKKIATINGKVIDVRVKNTQVTAIDILTTNGDREELAIDQIVFCTGSTNHPIMNPYTLPGGGISLDVQLSPNAPVGNIHTYTPERLVYMYPYAKDKMRLCTGMYMGKASIGESKMKKIHHYLKQCFHDYYGNAIKIENTINTYVGARPISIDAMPIVGKLPYLQNGYIVNGLGSYGYPAAALVEATLFHQSDSPDSPDSPKPPPNLTRLVDPSRFSPRWTSIARKLI